MFFTDKTDFSVISQPRVSHICQLKRRDCILLGFLFLAGTMSHKRVTCKEYETLNSKVQTLLREIQFGTL